MLPNSSPFSRIHLASNIGVRQSVPSSARYDATSSVILEDAAPDGLLRLLAIDDRDCKFSKYFKAIENGYKLEIKLKCTIKMIIIICITFVLDHCKEEEKCC